MTREIRRIEGELLEQTGDLRDRLEETLASQGRIWLNLLKQLQSASAGLVRTDATGARLPRHGGKEDEDASLETLMDENLRDATGYPEFASDPPNPLDPHPPASVDVTERETRRRPRRS
jgi:hypothetical protein